MKKTGLRRKTPLKSYTRIQNKTPISKVGPSTIRWKGWRSTQRMIVFERFSKCQLCKVKIPTNWHHAFGRSHIISEPWASYAPLTLALCDDDHLLVHRDSKARRAAELIAATQLIVALNAPPLEVWDSLDYTPIEIVKNLVNTEEICGRKPPGYEK